MGKFLVFVGKSDNHKGEYSNGDIIRIVSEDVFWNENKTNPKFPFPTSYINIIREPVKEKDVTDPLDYLYKLSKLEPQRLSIEELQRMKIEKSWMNLSQTDVEKYNYIGDEKNGEKKGKSEEKAGKISLPNTEESSEAEKIDKIFISEKKWLYFRCPSCLSDLSFPTQILTGENIKCPFCQHIFTIVKVEP